MRASISIDRNEIRIAIWEYIKNKTGLNIPPEALHIETKSAQNYKAEWEQAEIRVKVEVPVIT